jgi:class 3 adenylate cyclase/tetratricopeptide (TPR) repeat protein
VDLRRKAALAELLGRFLPFGIAQRLEESLQPGSDADPRVLPTLAERREVTVLFVDLSGFTALSEEVDPERLFLVVNRLFALVGEVADRWGGVIDKFMGDAALVVFGAPRTVEGAPARAVSCALEIQERVRTAGAELARSDSRIDLRVGCSIAAGTVISGVVGSPSRCDYTVLGDAVNVAARLQKACGPEEIVVERGIALAIDPEAARVDLEPLPPLPVKGKKEPIAAVRIRPRPGRAGNSLLEEPGVVGRRGELEAVESALFRIGSGAGGALLLVGEAGVGKSRLLAAAARRARSRAIPVVELRPRGQGPGALLRELFESVGDSLAVALLEAGDTESLSGLAAEALAARAGRRGFLVVVDDLPAVDAPSRARLAGALGPLAKLGGFLLSAARLPSPVAPDALRRSEELRAFDRMAILEVGPLPAFDAKRLLAQLRPGDAGDHPLLERLTREARGIPRALHQLAGGKGVEAELARVDGLSFPGAQAMKALALIGAADGDLLTATLEADPECARAALAEAAAQHLVREGPTGFELADGALREALVRRLVASERRHLHSRLARALDARQSSEAAVHHAQGEDARAASRALAELSERQLALGQAAQALVLARRGLERAGEAIPPADAPQLGLLEGRALLALGQRTEATSAFFAAFSGSAAAADRSSAAIELGHLLDAGGGTTLSAEVLASAARQTRACPGEHARLESERGSLAWERGEACEARRLWTEASRLADSAGDAALKGRCDLNLALLTRHEQGATTEAAHDPLEPPHQGTAGGAAFGRPIRLEPPHQGTAGGAAFGRPIRLERAEGEAARAGELLGRADVLEAAGDPSGALSACEEALAMARSTPRVEAEVRSRRARLLLAHGETAEGVEEAERCAQLYGRLRDAPAQARALRVLTESGERRDAAEALVALAGAVDEGAAAYYLREARALFEQIGDGPRAAAIQAGDVLAERTMPAAPERRPGSPPEREDALPVSAASESTAGR